MNKLTSVWVVVILLALTAAPAWAATLSQDEVEIEIEGAIEAIDLAAGSFAVGGTTFLLSDGTFIMTGRGRGSPAAAADLMVGLWVEATGRERPDGTIEATRVRIKDWVTGEEGERPGALQHPAAEKLAAYFGLEYEAVMAMHESGIGFGEILKAYRLAAAQPEIGMTGEELLEMKLSGMGWGQIRKLIGVRPGSGPPPWAGQGRKDSDHP